MNFEYVCVPVCSSFPRSYFKASLSVLCENRRVLMKKAFIEQQTDEAAHGSVCFGCKTASVAS